MIWNAKNGRVSVGGESMDYVSFGSGSKALVLLPGLSDGLTTVKGKALLLARPYRGFFGGYTVYMFSRKNCLTEGYTIRQMAADQAEAMAALGIGKACVMGVSQGGMIAQWLAVDCPERVEKLVLAVTAPCVNDTIRACVGRWIEYAKRGDHRRLMADTAEKSYSERALKKMRAAYPLLGMIGKPKSYDRFLINAQAILHFSALDALQSIACPTLILAGKEDQIVGSEAARILRENIRGSEMHIYPGLGHAAYEEARDFNSRVLDFLMKA